MKDQPTSAIGPMSRSEIEFIDDPVPGGSSNSLRLVIWAGLEEAPEGLSPSAKSVAVDFLERALSALRRS
jgi:hypothetical protein